MKKKIITTADGGLGNQMFQYAHALRCSNQLDTEVAICRRPYGTRAYALGDLFGIPAHPAHDYLGCLPVLRYKEGYFGDPDVMLRRIQRRFYVGENVVLIVGFFQNDAFFAGVEDRLRRMFTFGAVEPLEDTVAVHVRRGDYVGDQRFDLCTREYFLRGIEHFRQQNPNTKFQVFSDSPNEIRSWFVGIPGVEVLPPMRTEETLRRMVRCSGFVIPNSSFSWWASWMADVLPERVVAPSVWLRGEQWNIQRDGWTLLHPADGAKA